MSEKSGSARILVPLGLSPVEHVEAKLPVIAQHARAFDAEVLLLHVLGASPSAAPAGKGVVPAEEAHARVHLEAVEARVRRAGVRAASLVRSGAVAQVVRDTATEHRAQLIVVGRPPRGRLAGLFTLGLGNGQAEKIARLAPCPVLVIQPAAEPAAGDPRGAGRVRHAPRRFDEDAAHAGPLAPYVLGERTVEVSRIVGTVAPLSLGQDFRPLRRSAGQDARHRGTLKLMAEQPERLPPVGLYKLGYGYYVFSGHSQVAAALELGQAWIDATVTEYMPLENADAQRVQIERVGFERETGLTGIGAALPGTYARLRALITEYGTAIQVADMRTAATRWKTAIFRPLQRRLRQLRLNQHFPGERSADIAVRIAGHRAAASARRGRELYWEEALATFALTGWRNGASNANDTDGNAA